MNGSAVLVLTILLILGSMGWGEYTLRVLLRNKKTGSYLYLPVGISVTLILGGILTALNSCSMWLLLMWHVAGLLLLIGRSIKQSIFSRALLNIKSWLFPLAFGIIAAVCSLGTSASRSFQRMDDYPAYLYLAKKLVVTGGLIDPFNNRRILSYGGATLYQAIYLKFTGTQSVFAFDNVFAPLAVIITIYLFTRRFTINKFLVGFLCLVTIVGSGAGLAFNLSPRYSVTLLTLVLFMHLYDVRSMKSEETSAVPWIIIGLLLSALVTLRLDNTVAPVIATIMVIFMMKRNRVKSLIVVLVTSAIALSGWAVALYRSSGSLLYPLMNGTANKAYSNDPLHWSIGKYISLLWQVVTFNNEFVITAFVLVMGAVLLRSKGGDKPFAEILMIALIGWMVEVVAVCVLLKGYDPWMLARFLGPSVFAVGLFAVLALLAHDSATNPLLATGEKWWVQFRSELRRPFDYMAKRLYLIIGVVLSFAVCMGYQISVQELASKQSTKPLLTTQFHTTLNSFTSSFSNGVKVLNTSDFSIDPLIFYGRVFKQISAVMPKGAMVLSAVETPELLDMGKFSVSTLDFPGANSPAPGIPLGGSPAELMKYLRGLGYSYIVAQSPLSPGSVYYSVPAKQLAASDFYNYRATGNAIGMWDQLLQRTMKSGKFQMKFFGEYVVISTRAIAAPMKPAASSAELQLFGIN